MLVPMRKHDSLIDKDNLKMHLIANEKITLFFILLLATTIKLSVVMILNIEPGSDFASYMHMATTMLSTGHMDDGMGNVAYYSSGYPLFLVPFFALFGSTAEVAQFVNVALGVTSVLLVYLCSKYILPNWKWAAVSAFIWATYPPAVLYTEYVAKENLMVTLLLLQTLLLLRYPSSQNKTFLAVILGTVYGIGLLVGPAIILTGLLIGLVVTEFNVRKPILSNLSWNKVLACGFGCLIILSPWLAYTNSKLGKPILNTNGGFNLYLGNNANSTVHFIGIQDTPIGPEWHALREEKGEVESMLFLKNMAIDYILENPIKTLWLSVNKITYFWYPPIHEGRDGNQSKIENIVRSIWLFYYILVITAALLPFLFIRKLTRMHLILYATVLLYCLIHAAAYVIFRYRIPIMPFMCILAVSGISFVQTWWSSKKQSISK